MATTRPKGTTPGKDRRSGSTSLASFTRRPTKPTTPDRPSSSTPPNSSTTPKQHLPNYQRYSTSSSFLAKPTSFSKKHNVPDTEESKSPKPPANRRRSFDKPASPSGLRSLLTSPGRESKDAPPHRSKPLTASRSVLNVPKSTSKPVSSNQQKVWKPKSGSSTSTMRSPTRGTSGASKKDSRNIRSTSGTPSGTSRARRCRDITEILNLEANLNAMSRREIGEVDKIESIVEDNCQDLPDPKLGDEELDDQQQHHVSDNVTDANSVNNQENVDDKVETVIELKKNVECQHDQVDECNHINKDDQKSNVIDQVSDLTSYETKVEEAKKEEEEVKNVKDEEKHEVVTKEEQDKDVKDEAKAKEEVKAKVKPKEAVVVNAGSNKEAAPVYNDVIEETASKLMSQEKKWNKVKALVGAFETVIDYESGSKS